jgi:hypothetical protein
MFATVSSIRSGCGSYEHHQNLHHRRTLDEKSQAAPSKPANQCPDDPTESFSKDGLTFRVGYYPRRDRSPPGIIQVCAKCQNDSEPASQCRDYSLPKEVWSYG